MSSSSSSSSVVCRTPILLDLGGVDYSAILSLLAIGHQPNHQLIAVVAKDRSAAERAANWLKVTGLLTVPVYVDKILVEGESEESSVSSTGATAHQPDGLFPLLTGARYPPLASGTIHHVPLSKAYAEFHRKYGPFVDVSFASTEAEASPRPSQEFVRPLSHDATTVTNIQSNMTVEELKTLTASLGTTWATLLNEIIADGAFNLATVEHQLSKISSFPPSATTKDVLTHAITVANEKSHLNKVRKSKAPSQKVAKLGQVAASSSSYGSGEHVYPLPGPLPNATPLAPLDADSPYQQLQEQVTNHISGMLLDSLMYDARKKEHLFVLYDDRNELTRLIARGYQAFIKTHQLDETQATFLNFHDDTPESLLCRLFNLRPNDSVILIQSQQFRLSDYRIRLELFKKSIRSIEHVHLEIIDPSEYGPYIDALAFSPKDYGALAYTLKEIVDNTKKMTVTSPRGEVCEYTPIVEGEPCMQECKLNIGDYRFMKQVGGTYPIGEVFTEARSLKGVNGHMPIWGYPSLQKKLVLLDTPIVLHIVDGVLQFDPTASPPVIPLHATPEFIELLTLIRDGEGEIVIREFGMGLNKGMSRQRTVTDIFAFERQHGLHISLGKKHNVFAIEGIKGKKTTFHIDIFVDVETINCDGKNIFQNNEWIVDISKNYRGEPLNQQEQKQE